MICLSNIVKYDILIILFFNYFSYVWTSSWISIWIFDVISISKKTTTTTCCWHSMRKQELFDWHRKCFSFRMQFRNVTLPPTLSFFSLSVLIYICLLVVFILILIFITFLIWNFYFLHQISFFSLTNLLLFKSNC